MIKVKVIPQTKIEIKPLIFQTINLKVGSSTIVIENSPIENFTGNYNVVPKAFSETLLETKDKKMLDNVKVEKVPYYETSNEYGTTIYIADSAGGI